MRQELGCDAEYGRYEEDVTGRGSQASTGCMQCHVTFPHGAKLGYIPAWLIGRDDPFPDRRTNPLREFRGPESAGTKVFHTACIHSENALINIF